MKKNTAVLILRCAVALVTILGGARLLIALSHHGIAHLPTKCSAGDLCGGNCGRGIFSDSSHDQTGRRRASEYICSTAIMTSAT